MSKVRLPQQLELLVSAGRALLERWLAPFTRSERRLFLVIYGLIGGVLLGFVVGAQYYSDSMTEKRRIHRQLKDADVKVNALLMDNVELRTEHGIDSLSLEQLSKTVLELEQELAQTAEELRLYKSLMGVSQQSEDPFVRAVRLSEEADTGFAYRIIVEQGKKYKGKNHKVHIQVKLHGLLADGTEASYKLSELHDQFPNQQTALPIRYFKLLEGVVELPEAFSPQQLEASVWMAGTEAAITQSFPWQTGRALTPSSP